MADLIAHPQPLIILISALFLLLIPLAFIFVAFFSASITTKRIVQTVATVMLALATVGVGFFVDVARSSRSVPSRSPRELCFSYGCILFALVYNRLMDC